MGSKEHVKSISISNEKASRILFEGYLGELEGLSLIEEGLLEIRGGNGVLRIEMTLDELRSVLRPPCVSGA